MSCNVGPDSALQCWPHQCPVQDIHPFLSSAVDVLRQLNSILNDEEAFRALPPLPDTRMASPLEAELVARCMRRHDRNGNVQEAFLAAALVVLRDSVKRFPKSARLRVLYGNFLLSTLQNPQQAGEQFAAVRKMKSNFDIQFQVFCRGREQTQSSTGGASTEGAMDLVSSPDQKDHHVVTSNGVCEQALVVVPHVSRQSTQNPAR